MRNNTPYLFRSFLLVSVLSLSACNTTQETKPDVTEQSPTPQTTQSSGNQKASTASQSSRQQDSAQANKSDDEILNDALEELERKKSQENIESNESNTVNTAPASAANPAEVNAEETVVGTPPTGSLTSVEKTQQIDSKLDESFADFDALLLKEQERLTQEQNEQGDLSNAGGASGASGGNDFEEAGGGYGYDEQGDDISIASEEGETQQSDGSNPFPSNTTQADIPPDLVNTKGDDVIARQLREAALKEKDPELRERLWDEYRKYKQGTGR